MKTGFRRQMELKKQGREGWDILLKEQGTKQKSLMSRGSQRHISMGIGHHMPRMMKGHI